MQYVWLFFYFGGIKYDLADNNTYSESFVYQKFTFNK